MTEIQVLHDWQAITSISMASGHVIVILTLHSCLLTSRINGEATNEIASHLMAMLDFFNDHSRRSDVISHCDHRRFHLTAMLLSYGVSRTNCSQVTICTFLNPMYIHFKIIVIVFWKKNLLVLGLILSNEDPEYILLSYCTHFWSPCPKKNLWKYLSNWAGINEEIHSFT